MKRIGFIVQVLTLIAALPVLTIIELNHVTHKVNVKNENSYVIAPAEKRSVSFKKSANGEMPSVVKQASVKSKPGV